MFYWIAYFLLWLLSKIFFPITVYGSKHIPASGNVIIASNHVSNLDPIILGLAYKRHTSYLAKDSLFRNKIFGFVLLKVSSAFPIKRNTGDIGALREALKRLSRGDSLVMFPEGTRKSALGEKQPQQGIGFLAVKSGVPVIPAYILGSDKVMPPGAKHLARAAVTVIFGKPLAFARQNEHYEEITSQIMQQIDFLPSSIKA